jgi:hypothetical protein
MPRKSRRPNLKRVGELAKRYRTAQADHRAKLRAADAAAFRRFELAAQFRAAADAAGLATYRAVYAGKRDRSGEIQLRLLAKGWNLDPWLPGGPGKGDFPPTGHGGDQSLGCKEACDRAMNDVMDDPDWPGERYCTCDCIESGGYVTAWVECRAEPPDETVPEVEQPGTGPGPA